MTSLDEIKENNNELTLLISKIDNLNDKIKVSKDLNLQLKEKLKKSLSTDLAPLLVSQIEKIEEVLNNIDINALEELIIETNKFIDKEINNECIESYKN